MSAIKFPVKGNSDRKVCAQTNRQLSHGQTYRQTLGIQTDSEHTNKHTDIQLSKRQLTHRQTPRTQTDPVLEKLAVA